MGLRWDLQCDEAHTGLLFIAVWSQTTFALVTYLAANACADGVMLTVSPRSTSTMSAIGP
jgi:hypothetical protein